jgi:predicted ATPase
LLQQRLFDWFATAGRSRPVLLVIEDVHWADPSTLELLAKLAPRIGGLRMLMILSSRPAPAADWLDKAHGTAITLHRLSDEDTRRMIETIAGDHVLGTATIEMLGARMDGVPLFIEEITRAVVEADRAGTPRSGRPLMIPATLQESLAGRIDRVGVDREVLQLTATLGREFSLEVLGAVWGRDRARLQWELDKLLSSGLLEVCEIGGQIGYRYSHALILDAIYQFQLSGQRQVNHQHVADVLMRDFPDTCLQSPEVVANHLLEARNPAAALPYLQRAAQIAMQRSANIEAARYLHLALETVATLPPDRGRTYIELELLTSLGVIQSAQFGFASDEAGDAFARARALSRGAGRVAGLFPVLHGLYRFYLVRVELETAKNLSREMLKIARAESDPALLLEAHRAAGNCRFLAGDFGKAEGHFERTLSLYQPGTHHAHRFAYGTDPFVVAASMLGLTCFITGSRQRALRHMQQALDASEELNHPNSVCWALSLASLLAVSAGDFPGASGYSERLLGLAKRSGFGFWELPPNIMLGWETARHDPQGPGIGRMRAAIDGWRRTGAIAYLPFFLSFLADAYLRAGRIVDAEATIRETQDLVERSRELWWRAEMYRLEGRCALAKGAYASAEARFRDAIDFARRQRATSLIERAQADLDGVRNAADVISD